MFCSLSERFLFVNIFSHKKFHLTGKIWYDSYTFIYRKGFYTMLLGGFYLYAYIYQ